MRRMACVGVVLLVSVLGAAPAVAADEPLSGFTIESRELAPGLTHQTLRRSDPPLVVHVARLRPTEGGPSLRPVLSNEAISGSSPRLERSSAMCARVGCLVAVNADFALPGVDEPAGGMVVDGVVERSPVETHNQIVVTEDGRLTAGDLDVSGRVVSTELDTLPITSVNRPRGAEDLVLYTPAFAETTQTNDHGVEVVVRATAGPLFHANRTAVVELVELRTGGASVIPADGGVLSGHGEGAVALRSLWDRVQGGTVSRQVMVRLDVAPAAVQAVGGTPVLVRDGTRFVSTTGNDFVTGRHPRTIVGWTADGEVLLVTVDGRQPGYSEGISLPDAAGLMIALGSVEALNLDGGGSATFVVDGEVVNRPSDRLVRRGGRETVAPTPRSGDTVLGNVERPVVSVLAIVAGPSNAPAGSAPVSPPRLVEEPQVVRYIAVGDPASIPGGSSAVVAVSGPGATDAEPALVLLAVVLLAGVAVGAFSAVKAGRTGG
jgi:large repetitive protein